MAGGIQGRGGGDREGAREGGVGVRAEAEADFETGGDLMMERGREDRREGKTKGVV